MIETPVNPCEQAKYGNLQSMEARTGTLRGIQRDCKSRQGSGYGSLKTDRIKFAQGCQGEKEKLLKVY